MFDPLVYTAAQVRIESHWEEIKNAGPALLSCDQRTLKLPMGRRAGRTSLIHANYRYGDAVITLSPNSVREMERTLRTKGCDKPIVFARLTAAWGCRGIRIERLWIDDADLIDQLWGSDIESQLPVLDAKQIIILG